VAPAAIDDAKADEKGRKREERPRFIGRERLPQHWQSWQIYIDRKRRYRRKKSKNENPAALAGNRGAGFHSKVKLSPGSQR
jgi:hypothetical protein